MNGSRTFSDCGCPSSISLLEHTGGKIVHLICLMSQSRVKGWITSIVNKTVNKRLLFLSTQSYAGQHSD